MCAHTEFLLYLHPVVCADTQYIINKKIMKYISPKMAVVQMDPASVICVSNVIRTLALSEIDDNQITSWDPED